MRNILYLYSQEFLFKIIKEILTDYEILPLTLDELNNPSFKNKNSLLVLKNDTTKKINKFFFSNNNVVIFLANKQELIDKTKTSNVNFCYGPLSIKKFFDEIKFFFITKTLVLKNIEILGEKISNVNSRKSLLLTSLEKEILIVLFENKKIKREYLLEEILKIKKDIETKTIESHLTRIRKKLINLSSEIQIKSKGDIFYLDV